MLTCTRCDSPLKMRSRCPSCGAWNLGPPETSANTIALSEVQASQHQWLKTGPWDKNFGSGGIPITGVALLGAPRGAGKSTIAMQIADRVARQVGHVTYLSSEESGAEIRLRGERLGIDLSLFRTTQDMCNFAECMRILESPWIDNTRRPAMMVIDSFTGMVGDSREAALTLTKQLKKTAVMAHCPVLVIDQITKDCSFAGPEAVQHGVDIVLALALNAETKIRTLHTLKTRFGPAHVETFYDMTETGLTILTKEQKRELEKLRRAGEDEDEEIDEK